MKNKFKILAVLAAIVAAGVYYYIALPAINIHSAELWFFMILVVVVFLAAYVWKNARRTGEVRRPLDFSSVKGALPVKISGGLAVLLLVVYLVGTLLSSPIVNAAKYQQLLTVEDSEFSTDIKQLSFTQIPLLDKNSAALLANRKMGSLVDLASQFVVGDLYAQINYQGRPVRVTPLEYASLIKWFTNYKEGLPGYIKIDMTNQDTELVRLPEGIKYSPYDHFGRNLNRHLRFNYPTYIFDQISFEIDDEGIPYWVCGVKQFNIGLFGGQTIGRVVLCNAVTGECEDYAIDDVPHWVDKAYSAELLIQLYDYYGTLKHGFFNSIFGQRDCLQTTNGYNYLALNDDVWVYTGVTSVTSDQSNVGFVLMNQRTRETKFYQVEGAIEESAMSSAQGQVQHLGYQATFPLLLNIADEPTYFIALKDEAGLVKKYAMVNVEKYQVVAIGDSVGECEKDYISLLKSNGISTTNQTDSVEKVTGKISRIFDAVVEGNSHCYVMLEGSDVIYDVSVADYLPIIKYQEGDTITMEYLAGESSCTVLGIVE